MARKNETTETIVKQGILNEVIIHTKQIGKRKRIQFDYEFCPTMAEQHTAHLSDINYLMEKYKPDELAAYIAARNSHRQEVIGIDFSQEPNLQEAMNETYRLKQAFNDLPDDITKQFKNHVEFLKFIDNPANQDKLIKMGILSKKQIDSVLPSEVKTPETATSNKTE